MPLFFPVVEIDNPFYGVPTAKAVTGWQKKVPDKFQFILKANREMTKHPAINKMEPPLTERERRQVFENYRRMVDPLVKRHQLKTILFQFPPFFLMRLLVILNIYNKLEQCYQACQFRLSFEIKLGLMLLFLK